MNDILIRLAPVLALCAAVPAIAQPERADPADAKASAPALRYRSAFADYKPWHDIKPGNWRDLNDKLAPAPRTDSGASRRATTGSAPAAQAPAAAPAHAGHRSPQGARP